MPGCRGPSRARPCMRRSTIARPLICLQYHLSIEGWLGLAGAPEVALSCAHAAKQQVAVGRAQLAGKVVGQQLCGRGTGGQHSHLLRSLLL